MLVPDSLDDAVAGLVAHPERHSLAGGTDLMVEVNEGHRSPTATRCDRGHAFPSCDWTYDPSPARHARGRRHLVRDRSANRCAAWCRRWPRRPARSGSPQIRNAGTVGGNLATCSPAGDGLPVFAALDADGRLVAVTGRRSLPVSEFMIGVKRTALAAGGDDRVDHAAVARRLAGVQQGRRAQRDGDRHRQRLPGRRRCRPLDADRARLGGADDHPLPDAEAYARRRRRLGRQLARRRRRDPVRSSAARPAARSTTTARPPPIAVTRSR